MTGQGHLPWSQAGPQHAAVSTQLPCTHEGTCCNHPVCLVCVQEGAAMPSGDLLVGPFQAFTAFGTGSNSQTPPAKVCTLLTLQTYFTCAIQLVPSA